MDRTRASLEACERDPKVVVKLFEQRAGQPGLTAELGWAAVLHLGALGLHLGARKFQLGSLGSDFDGLELPLYSWAPVGRSCAALGR